MQKHHGTRDEGNTTHTLHARRVVFRCRLFLPLAVSTSFINSCLPDGDYVLDEVNFVVAQNRNCFRAVVDTITTTTSQQLVVMPEACRGG